VELDARQLGEVSLEDLLGDVHHDLAAMPCGDTPKDQHVLDVEVLAILGDGVAWPWTSSAIFSVTLLLSVHDVPARVLKHPGPADLDLGDPTYFEASGTPFREEFLPAEAQSRLCGQVMHPGMAFEGLYAGRVAEIRACSPRVPQKPSRKRTS
jgi:hypothetical protein